MLARWIAPLLVSCACLGCGGPRVADDTPIVLISIDTLRSDRLPAYGYANGATPAIDRLARDGILFERAYSHAPTTLPAHASLLTGLLPPRHGVRDNAGYRLDPAVPTLAEELRAAGYATGAAVSSFVLRRASGLDRGFDRYDDGIEFDTRAGLGALQRGGEETLARAVEWLDTIGERPGFLFLHLFEPHAPYAPPPPFADRHADPYDGEIAAADHVVGRLIDELERRGLYRRALIVLLSDHGEGLGDHGEQEHGLLLYREALQVPLILKLPGADSAGARVAAPAQLIDLLPTLLEALGRPIPAGVAGRSLFDLLDGNAADAAIYSETIYPRLHFGWSDLASIVEGNDHYIEGPERELYDLARDPRERSDRSGPDAARVQELASRLARVDRSIEPPGAVDAETRARLASLGYLGGSSLAADIELPDPKRRLHVLDALRRAQALYARREFAAAAAAFRDLVTAEPRLLDAWDWLGRALEAAGRPDEALAAYRDAMALTDGPSLLALSAGRLLLGLNRLDEAAQHAKLAREADPAEALLLEAQIARRRGDLDQALELARASVAQGDTRFGPQLTLADVLIARREWEAALERLERVESAYAARDRPDPGLIRGLYLLRGQALANLGDAAEAEASFRREIESFPRDPRAYTHLAILYTLTGRPEVAATALRQLTAALPIPAGYAEAVRTAAVLGDVATARELLREGRERFPDSPLLDAAEASL